jgi:SAM-dependent methyltransferase
LFHTFADLGVSPLANRFLTSAQLNQMEPFYPLHAYVCSDCLLVQLEEFESPEGIFTDYAYFASYSDSWVEHARVYTDMATERFRLGPSSRVVEIASNDGYLLQHFVAKGIPVLGIEPAANVAGAAIQKGVPTLVEFFGEALARRLAEGGTGADLVVGNNVLAHVPALNDFLAGMALLLRPGGTITMEFPHLLNLIEETQFDTIYHEHFSYFSLWTVEQAFARHGLQVFDVEELSTHGGSLRIYARHASDPTAPVSRRIEGLREREKSAGLDRLGSYLSFGNRVKETKRNLLKVLIDLKRARKTIVGYGAPAKGNTLLNYCGIGSDFLDYTVDRSPHKQGRFLPGTHIPVCSPDRLAETRPDYLLILPWNLTKEIVSQMTHIRSWGGRFVVPVPTVEVLA